MAQEHTIISDPTVRRMWPYTKPPRRRLDQVVTSMVNAFGGYKVVASMCMAPGSVSKWMEDPSGSGQTISLTHLLTLLAFAGEALTNFPLQIALDELIQDHFLNLCHRRAYLEEHVFAVVEMLNGSKPKLAKEG